MALPTRFRRIARGLTQAALFLGLPLLLVTILPRKTSARHLAPSTAATWSGPAAWRTTAPGETLQRLVDALRQRLTIAEPVVVSVVSRNDLLVSVEHAADRPGAFQLAIEASLIDTLSDEELQAVVAHELGHVWIFTHHPYLQTEMQANEVALRLVSRDALERVYEKVWKRTGAVGRLQYLPAAPPAAPEQ